MQLLVEILCTLPRYQMIGQKSIQAFGPTFVNWRNFKKPAGYANTWIVTINSCKKNRGNKLFPRFFLHEAYYVGRLVSLLHLAKSQVKTPPDCKVPLPM